jgi:hypothetical protein
MKLSRLNNLLCEQIDPSDNETLYKFMNKGPENITRIPGYAATMKTFFTIWYEPGEGLHIPYGSNNAGLYKILDYKVSDLKNVKDYYEGYTVGCSDGSVKRMKRKQVPPDIIKKMLQGSSKFKNQDFARDWGDSNLVNTFGYTLCDLWTSIKPGIWSPEYDEAIINVKCKMKLIDIESVPCSGGAIFKVDAPNG